MDLNSSERKATYAETVRQPLCPEEKEKAIKDVLEYFGMVSGGSDYQEKTVGVNAKYSE